MLGNALECMMMQSIPPREIIVVDDGSTDNTCAEVERFAKFVTLIRQENRGPGAARNAGLARATGEFVQFFDSDDLATLNLLEAKLEAITATGADLAYGPWMPVRIEGAQCFHDGVVRQVGPVGNNPLSEFLRGWVLFLPNCLFRREVIMRLGGYPTDIRTAEDLLLLFSLLAGGVRMAFAPEPLVLVRQHPQSQISASSEGASMRAQEYYHFTSVVRRQLKRERLPVSWLDRLLWRMNSMQSGEKLTDLGVGPLFTTDDQAIPASATARWISNSLRRAFEIKAGLRARVTGSRLPRSFRIGRINQSQLAAIQQLGYIPVQTNDLSAIASESKM